MKNYYAVRVGYNTGIYDYLDEAKDQIRGYSNAEWKGFNNYDDAEEYLNEYDNNGNNDGRVYYVWEDMIFDNQEYAERFSGGYPCEVFYNLDDARDEVLDQYNDFDERFREDLNYVDDEGDTIYQVYTDGACVRNGRPDARAGCGIYFGANNPYNESKILGGRLQTNQRAELVAIKRAYQIIKGWNDGFYYEILTDSDYAIKCLTVWWKKWERNGWVNTKGEPVANQDKIRDILRLMDDDACSRVIGLVKVQAHSDCEGNNEADELARDAAQRHYNGDY